MKEMLEEIDNEIRRLKILRAELILDHAQYGLCILAEKEEIPLFGTLVLL